MAPTFAYRGGPQGAKTSSTPQSYARSGVRGKTSLPGKRRHRRIIKDAIQGITRPAIRRLARRGGVKRISGDIYGAIRDAMRKYLEDILKDCILYVEHRNGQTVMLRDVITCLRRRGRTLYGCDPGAWDPRAHSDANRYQPGQGGA